MRTHGSNRFGSGVRATASCVMAISSLVVSAAACGSGATVDRQSEPTPIESVATTVVTTTMATTTTVARAVAGTQLPPGSNTVYVLGDSVTLGAATQIPAALASWSVTFDAKESRRIDQGDDVLVAQARPVARVLVVHLCTNWAGGDFRAAADTIMKAARGVERVVWVTCFPWLPAVATANSVIKELPGSYPNVVVADWGKLAATPGYTYDDNLHLKSPGASALASLIASTIGPVPVSR